jgi:hypothetical protein
LLVSVEDGDLIVRVGAETVRGQALAGREVVVETGGPAMVLRIGAVEHAPHIAGDAIWAFEVSVIDEHGHEEPYCAPDRYGLRLAVPLRGRWTSDGRFVQEQALSLACTSGAIGKCLAYGYGPWRPQVGSKPMRGYLEACTRMLRADYCGTGDSWTRDGVAMFHRGPFNQDERFPSDLPFEAAWGPDGAICVRHARASSVLSLEALRNLCPDRVPASAIDQPCTVDGEHGGAWLMSGSSPTTSAQ